MKTPLTESLSSAVIGLSVAESTATITFLRNNRTRALATVEATAGSRTIGIASALTGDELRARRLARTRVGGRSRRGSRRLSRAWDVLVRGLTRAQRNCSAIVRHSVTEAAATITFLSDNGASTETRPETAASRCAIRITAARASDELSARRLPGASALGRRRRGLGCAGNDLVGSLGGTESYGGTVVGHGVTESTAAIAFLGNNGTSTETTAEATAAGCTITIAAASASDELSARGLARSSALGRRGCSLGCAGNDLVGSLGGTESNGGAIVGHSVTESAATIAFLCNNGTRAETAPEAAAARGTVAITAARARDELSARGLARPTALWRSSGLS